MSPGANEAGGTSRDDLAAFVARVAGAAAGALPGYVSIIWKGSTYKPWDGPYDYFPGLSDIDVHVYRPGGADDHYALRRTIVDHVGEPPGDSPLQLLVLDTRTLPDWWTLLPATFGVIRGQAPPVPIPPRTMLLARDRIGLAEAEHHADQVVGGLVTQRDDELWGYLRSLRWMFPAVLTRAISVAGAPPEKVWTLNRTEQLDLASENPDLDPVRHAAVAYFDAALAACADRGDISLVEAALRQGERLLRIGHAWAEERPEVPDERRAATWWQR